MPWFKASKQSQTLVGVSLCSHAIRAVSLKQRQQQWYVKDTVEVALPEGTSPAAALTQLLKGLTRDNSQIYVLLPQHYYQIVQMEKPALAEQELIQSLAWTLKDLVNIKGEHIVADYLDYPIQVAGQGAKINVFVADKQELHPLVNEIHKVQEWQLQSISAKETVIANMTSDDNYARLVIFHERGQEPSILIIRERQLLLNRRLRGFKMLEQDLDQSGINHLGDSLGLEIQRSMDFFESQLKQPPIKEVLFFSDLDTAAVIERLQQLQAVPIARFTPQMPLADVVEPEFYLALAGAYLPQLESA
ncbi:MSHA biogenesis protein MshI [Pseudoalteromonas qingdaonensis]